MFELEIKKNVEIVDELLYAIREYRISYELNKNKEEYEKRTPKEVNENDGFFKKIKKGTTNAINKSEYEKHLNAYNEIKDKFEKFKLENEKYSKYNIDNVFEDAVKLFKNDKFGIAKLEFSMNVVLDNTINYQYDDETLKKVSTLLGYDTNYLSNLKEKLQNTYVTLSKDYTSIFKDVFKTSTITLGVGLSASIIAAIVAVGTAVAITSSSVLIAALAVGIITFGVLNEKENNKLLNDFKNLTVEETALSVSKTILILKQLDLYKSSTEAKKLYDELIEEYIDLKSDLDVRIFVGKEDLENNNKKSNIFTKADNLLKQELNLI